jgi:hypothetical protein
LSHFTGTKHVAQQKRTGIVDAKEGAFAALYDLQQMQSVYETFENISPRWIPMVSSLFSLPIIFIFCCFFSFIS